MDDDEMLYRMMNEDDEWYMGDKPDDDHQDSECDDYADNRSNSGCAVVVAFLTLTLFIIVANLFA